MLGEIGEELIRLGFKPTGNKAGNPAHDDRGKKESRGDDSSQGQRPEQDSREEAPKRVLPLYVGVGRDGNTSLLFMENGKIPYDSGNTGLLFDKFCDHWSGKGKWREKIDERSEKNIPKGQKALWNANPKIWFLKTIAEHCQQNERARTLLKNYNERRCELLKSFGGEKKEFKTSWRFVSGLGMGHVLETGFVWHRLLGVPYLPGSSVKGLIRAWAKSWEEEGKWENEYKKLFGDSDEKMGAGSLIVFDAIPQLDDLPKGKRLLELDVMNPHYSDYYAQKEMDIGENGQKIKTPPADYLSPVPIFFLTVAPDISFEFALAPLPGVGTEEHLKKGLYLLERALENLGAGAKTAVGYGRMKIEQNNKDGIPC